MPLRYVSLFSLLCVCAGCASINPTPTRTAPGFNAGMPDRVAVLFTGATVSHNLQNKTDRDASIRLDSSAAVLASRYLAYFHKDAGSLQEAVWRNPALGNAVARSVYQVLGKLSKSRRSNLTGLHVAPDVVGLQAYTPARYALAVQFSAWDMDRGLRTLATLPLGGPTPVTIVARALLIDLSTAEVVWYTRNESSLNPRNPVHVDAQMKALLLEFCTGRRLAPESFLISSDEGDVLTAYPFEGKSISGTLKSYAGYSLALRQKDGSLQTVELTSVKYIRREWPTTATLFP